MRLLLIKLNQIKSTLFSFYEKVLPFFDTKKQKLSDFLNLPQVKLFRNNLLISSLLLIPIKLFFFTTFPDRIALLLFFTLISSYFNTREKIKRPIWFMLSSFLGEYYYSTYSVDQDYTDFLRTYLAKYMPEKYFNTPEERYYLRFFKSVLFFQYLFQRFYYFITSFRYYCDMNPYRYILTYYIIIFLLIWTDTGGKILILSCFLILTRLAVYIDTNNYGEMINELQKTRIFPDLEKDIRIPMVKDNILVVMYYNLIKKNEIENTKEIPPDNILFHYLKLMIKGNSLNLNLIARNKIIFIT